MDYQINGYYKYVVPPLEGFWWQEDNKDFDINNKNSFNWISVIRLPDFITKEDFNWAVKTATIKKKIDCSKAEYKEINEGLCVQIMHIGPFDDEYKSVNLIDEYIKNQGYIKDLSPNRLHHEIYLTDARKVEPSKYKTIIRLPIRKA